MKQVLDASTSPNSAGAAKGFALGANATGGQDTACNGKQSVQCCILAAFLLRRIYTVDETTIISAEQPTKFEDDYELNKKRPKCHSLYGSLYPGRACSCHSTDENGECQPDAELYIFDCLALRCVKKDYPAQG